MDLSNSLTRVRLYDGGNLQFRDTRVGDSLTFAHVTDFHLAPDPPELWPEAYRHGIAWWDAEMLHPDAQLAPVLDEIRSHQVDFVFFGGDILDYYHPESAKKVLEMCRQRELPAYFQVGNHDCDSEHIRYVTHEFDEKVRSENCGQLCGHWGMPGLYYSFELMGVRFVALDTPYLRLESGNFGGRFDPEQATWFAEQLKFNGPIVVFHHVPFCLPTLEPRLRLHWRGILACVEEDDSGLRVKRQIEESQNILGTFAGHAHLRSEDPIGNTWQFTTDAGYRGQWRYVKIAASDPPKSLRVPGTPDV